MHAYTNACTHAYACAHTTRACQWVLYRLPVCSRVPGLKV